MGLPPKVAVMERIAARTEALAVRAAEEEEAERQAREAQERADKEITAARAIMPRLLAAAAAAVLGLQAWQDQGLATAALARQTRSLEPL